ncbi:hypothetical protein QC762_0111900 [Podospora pseudocomata]|uniref:Uncharacterized protein n=1 Tax=Podospora pseudocomata TaxID=2093779 RepID=A0ABR0G4M6_9PEZI|nr:hypothetical protein QC762_0111900 [Podospora pseudocomata]
MADVVIFLYAIRKLRFQLSIAPRSTARRKKFSHHTHAFPSSASTLHHFFPLPTTQIPIPSPTLK